MSIKIKTTTKKSLIALGVMLVMILMLAGINASKAYATDGETDRTIMIYMDGAASEENNRACSDMIEEYVSARFDRENFRVIVVTGGSLKWHLDAKYLRDKDGNPDTLTEISGEYNQIWEVYGATDDAEGYIKLIDGDGVTGEGVKSEDELMSDPSTLKEFINYAKAIAPADKYDLFLNDHGCGPGRGYGFDDHDPENPEVVMHVLKLKKAISESDVVKNGGKFDIINFDCCMMGNFETILTLADYTDYFLGSADVAPLPTVDYTALFNFLNEDPDMDGKDLGRKYVDLYVQYYEEHPEKGSIGSAILNALVDTKKFKESGITEELLKIAKQMRAEATDGNFYDEIRTSKEAYCFAYHYLQDFATVVEQLGINIYEGDFQDPELKNAYTDSALKIQNILHNEDIIYAKHTEDSEKAAAFLGRDVDGAIIPRGNNVPTSGLNIFYARNPTDGDTSANIAYYIDAMEALKGSLENEKEKELIDTYLQAIIDYELIYNAGIAVSTMVENGSDPSQIDYNKVVDYLKSEKERNRWEYISKAIASSDRNVEAWLGKIIDDQKKEVLSREKASLKTESKDGTDYYRVDISDTPKRIIDIPVLTVKADKKDEIFFYPTMTFYGSAASYDSDDYMTSTNSSYLIPKFDGQWYAVEDSDGVRHIASKATDQSVYAAFTLNGKNLGPGELIFDDDGNAKSIYVYGNTIPIPLDTLEGVLMVTLCNDPSGGKDEPLTMPFILDGTNARLVKAHYSELGIGSVEITISMMDLYEVKHEIKPELKFDPNSGTWKDGGSDIKKYEADLEKQFDIIGAPKRDGYTFICWRGSRYQPGQKYLVDSDHTFTAEWKKNDSDDSGNGSNDSRNGSDDPGNGSNDSGNDAGKDHGKSGNGARTGDTMTLLPLLLFMLASGGALTALAVRRRRSN